MTRFLASRLLNESILSFGLKINNALKRHKSDKSKRNLALFREFKLNSDVFNWCLAEALQKYTTFYFARAEVFLLLFLGQIVLQFCDFIFAVSLEIKTTKIK